MTNERGKDGHQGGTGQFTTVEWLQHVKFGFNLLMVMERSNCLVSLQACLNLNAIGIELSLLLFEAGLHSGLDCRILPVHPRARAEKKETRFFRHCLEKVFLTPLTLGNGRMKHGVL